MKCLLTTLLLGLLTISMTSGQQQGMTCYSCTITGSGMCTSMGLGQEHNVSCSYQHQCFVTFITGASGQILYGKRGCTSQTETIPMTGLQIDWNGGCKESSGYKVCRYTCFGNFCNSQNMTGTHTSLASDSGTLQLSALMVGAGTAVVMMLVYHVLPL